MRTVIHANIYRQAAFGRQAFPWPILLRRPRRSFQASQGGPTMAIMRMRSPVMSVIMLLALAGLAANSFMPSTFVPEVASATTSAAAHMAPRFAEASDMAAASMPADSSLYMAKILDFWENPDTLWAMIMSVGTFGISLVVWARNGF